MSELITIGQIMVEQGLLTEAQATQIVNAQRERRMPFAAFSERWYGLSARDIQAHWPDQPERFQPHTDLDQIEVDPRAVAMIDKAAAWRYEMLPVGWTGEGDIRLAISNRRMARGVRYAATHFDRPVNLWLVDPSQVLEYLQFYFPVPGIPVDLLDRARDAERTQTKLTRTDLSENDAHVS